jgi:hypothetical protein
MTTDNSISDHDPGYIQIVDQTYIDKYTYIPLYSDIYTCK